jgi:hypothetical protein
MELEEALNVRPYDYLRHGFLTEQRVMRDGINGVHSLAMAYQCRMEEINLDEFQRVVDQISKSSVASPANEKLLASLKSSVITNLWKAAEPWLKDPAQYKAFVSHLRRILQQTALLMLTPTEEIAAPNLH